MILKTMNFAIGGIMMGWGLKLLVFLDNWVYLPYFPNILDFMIMSCLGIVLMAEYVYIGDQDAKRTK